MRNHLADFVAAPSSDRALRKPTSSPQREQGDAVERLAEDHDLFASREIAVVTICWLLGSGADPAFAQGRLDRPPWLRLFGSCFFSKVFTFCAASAIAVSPCAASNLWACSCLTVTS